MSEVHLSIELQGSNSVLRKRGHLKRIHSIGRIIARILLVLLFVMSCFLSVFPGGRSAILSTFLLPALISGSESIPLNLIGESVHFTRSTLSSDRGPVFLDVYEPMASPSLFQAKHAAIITIVGVGDNRDAPQLINLSRSFAREGIIVVNMATPALFNFEVLPQDSTAVIQTFKMLSNRTDVDPGRIGIIGFSAGGTLACLAAADLHIRDQVAFISLFGTYFDATSLLETFGRRAMIVDGHWQNWQPYYIPKEVLANAFTQALTSHENTLFQQAFTQNGLPLNVDEQEQLTTAAQAAYHLLAGDEPPMVKQNIAALTPQMRDLLAQLSPSQLIDRIHTPIYLLHDRSDQYVPFTQSREFATALMHRNHQYDFAEFGIFKHVEVRADNGFDQLIGDGSQLFRILNKMLSIAS